MVLRPNGLHHTGVVVLLMPLYVGQLLSSDMIHGKHYGYYSLMEVPTCSSLHQFFLESCRARRILADFFQPLSSSKKIVCKVATLGRLSLLPRILFQFGSYLHTIYAGSKPSANFILMPLECLVFVVTNL